jgi:hypothetical protein
VTRDAVRIRDLVIERGATRRGFLKVGETGAGPVEMSSLMRAVDAGLVLPVLVPVRHRNGAYSVTHGNSATWAKC